MQFKKTLVRLLIVLMLLHELTMVSVASDGPVLRYGVYALPASLDPAWGTTTGDDMLKVNLYEGLTTYDSSGNVVPGAAERWEISSDGLHYTFYLRKGLRWSDGSALNAQQFANTILRVLQGRSENQPTFHYTLLRNANEILQKKLPLSALGLEVIDDHTLHFELTRPASYFPEVLVIAGLPTPGLLGATLQTKELKPTQWVTNGAYQVASYNPQAREYRFVKNPYYHRSKQLYFKTVQLQHFLRPNQAFFALISNQLDSYDRYAGDQLDAMKSEQGLVKVVPLSSTTTDYLTLNTKDTALKDRRVRKALSLALNRAAIVKALGYNNSQRSFSFSPDYPSVKWQKLPAIWGDESIDSRRQRALALMTEAGYGINRRLQLEFLVNKGDTNEQLAELVRQQWEKIGVDLKVISHPTAVHYSEYLQKGRFQVARAGWTAVYPDPSSFLEELHPQQEGNFGSWKNEEYTNKINYLMNNSLTPKQRFSTFLSLETLIQQEVPIIPIYNKSHIAILASWLKAVNQQQASYLLWRHFRPEGGVK